MKILTCVDQWVFGKSLVFGTALVLAVVFPSQSYGNEDSVPKADGNLLLEMCTAAVRSLDGDTNANAVDSSFCLGYVAGFEAGHNTAVFENRRGAQSPKLLLFFVLPNDQSPRCKWREFWLSSLKIIHNDNPQSLDLPMEILTQEALMRAFPCME